VSGDAAFEGKKSFKMTARTNQYRYLSGVTPTPIPINQTTVRTISGLKKGTDYVVSAYINVPAAEKGEAKIRISGSGTSEVSETVNLPQVTGWRRLDVGFRPTYDGSVAVTLAMEKVEEKTVVYWDGVQVEKGTKPTEFTEEVIPGETTGYTNQNMNIILYVFANHKKTTTSFNTEYAGYVPAKDIQKMAYNDDGTPWMKTSKKMYLTKLTRNMSQAQMTDDLVIRDADDNDTVGGGQAGLIDGWWKAILVLGVPVTAEIVGVCYFWYSRSIKKKETIG
jgi:hypothetical protein